MPQETRIVAPGTTATSVRTAEGKILDVPKGWKLLSPGDAGLTRRVKAGGPSWTVKEKVGRRTISRGVWAPAERIVDAKERLEAERGTEAYAKRRASDAKRRAAKQEKYVDDFRQAVVVFLDFDQRYQPIASRLATAVTDHATPVGSGTVARTQRIPIERRAESAVIAWMRHQTTAYDDMRIARVKGRRREVRRELAQQSKELLQKYRLGDDVDLASCPLATVVR
jgi:hypothetical protein